MASGDRRLTGLRGWLLLLVLTLGLFSPLRLIYHAFASLYARDVVARMGQEPGWPAYRVAETITFCAHIAILLFMAWRLVKVRHWSSVRLCVAGIWAATLGLLLVECALGVILLGATADQMIDIAFGPAIQGAIFCSLWTGYLLRSRRVANTYPDRSDDDRLAAVFD